MASKVGPKGQVVIEHRIREALGVRPGARAFQTLVGDHMEIRFLPPTEPRSLFGVLRPHVRRWPTDPDDTDAAWVAGYEGEEEPGSDEG